MGSGSPPAWPEILQGKLPVDNTECGSCLGALGPWLTSGIICDEVVSTLKAGAGELLSVVQSCSIADCLLVFFVLDFEGKKKIVVFSMAVIISKYSDGDKMLFQLPLVNINSRRSISQ